MTNRLEKAKASDIATLGAARQEGAVLIRRCIRWGLPLLLVLFVGAALRSHGSVATGWWLDVCLLALLAAVTTGLRSEVKRSSVRAALDLAAAVPAPSDRPALRAEEIGALAMLAAACSTAATAARDRARSIASHVLAATSSIATTLQPRLATSLVARYAATSAA